MARRRDPDEGPPANSLVAQPELELPGSLSDVGLFRDLSKQTPYDVAMAYEPVWPLWSNGSAKQRYLVLPKGVRVDTTDPERWRYPVGTLLFKTFSFEFDGASRPVETRLMRRSVDGWDFATYLWNEQSTRC